MFTFSRLQNKIKDANEKSDIILTKGKYVICTENKWQTGKTIFVCKIIILNIRNVADNYSDVYIWGVQNQSV